MTHKAIRRIGRDDLIVGLICADPDGNRIRLDRVDSGLLAYHFLNDELRVQEGVRELPIEGFLKQAWYIAGSGSL